MKTALRTTLALSFTAALGASAAQASVLDFEDLPAAPGSLANQFFLEDYHGFRIGTNDIGTTAWMWSVEATPKLVPHSPTHFLVTDPVIFGSGVPEVNQSISSATDFVFDGAWFSGEGQIRYELYNNGQLVHRSANAASLSAGVSSFVGSGYGGAVDAVVVYGRHGFYAMDDFTYNSSAAVPEPGTVGLMLAGLLATAGRCATLRRSKACGR